MKLKPGFNNVQMNNNIPGAIMPSDKKIVVSKNGPYIVTGGIPLSIQTIIPNNEGLSWEWKQGRAFKTEPVYHLCRCGQSKDEPFCDVTHKKIHARSIGCGICLDYSVSRRKRNPF